MVTTFETMDAVVIGLPQTTPEAPHERVRRRRQRRRIVAPKRTIRISSSDWPLDWHAAIQEFRRRLLITALEKFDWNIKRTAEELGVVRRTLQIQMRDMGLEKSGEISIAD